MFCPSCGDEFRPGFTRCPDCHVDLVESVEETTGQPARPAPDAAEATAAAASAVQPVLETDDAELLALARDRLAAVGIRTSVEGEHLLRRGGAATVLVAAARADEAIEVLAGIEGAGAPGVVRQRDEVPLVPVAAGRASQMHVLLGPDDGAPGFALRRFVMGEGGGMPLHTNQVEHEQYVLCGRARVTVGDEVHEVGAGHVLFIPALTPHAYEVLAAPFEFLCIVPNLPDRLSVLAPAEE